MVPLISRGSLTAGILEDRVAVVTGAGGGIGFEAARSLLWLGARVAIAEIDPETGARAAATLSAEATTDRVLFVQTDVADETSVRAMAAEVERRLGPVEILIHNAGYFPVGETIAELPVEVWDRSYAVNLRGVVLATRAFLPGMTARRRGVIAFVSSTGGALMAAYEAMKAAQVSLGAALDQELAGTGVTSFTIGPGLVPTPTAVAAIERIAPKLGLTVSQLYAAVPRAAILSVEAAGAGFAAAVAMADRYAGQEISSTQALIDAGIDIPEEGSLPPGVVLPAERVEGAEPGSRSSSDAAIAVPAELAELAHLVRVTLDEQSDGFRKRSFFERQWVTRDFKQRAGMPVEQWQDALARLDERIAAGDVDEARRHRPPLERLSAYYGHLAEMARGYVKDPDLREEQVAIVLGWQRDADSLDRALRA